MKRNWSKLLSLLKENLAQSSSPDHSFECTNIGPSSSFCGQYVNHLGKWAFWKYLRNLRLKKYADITLVGENMRYVTSYLANVLINLKLYLKNNTGCPDIPYWYTRWSQYLIFNILDSKYSNSDIFYMKCEVYKKKYK